MSLSIWKVENNNVILDNSKYLLGEFGVALKALQDENTINAIKDPKDFIEKRSEKIADMFGTEAVPGPVTAAFFVRYEELKKLFIPEDIAREMAKKSALRVYNEQIELLELQMPDGYSKAFGIAGVEHNAILKTNDIAFNEHDVIAKYKAYKKQKKAAKSEK